MLYHLVPRLLQDTQLLFVCPLRVITLINTLFGVMNALTVR